MEKIKEQNEPLVEENQNKMIWNDEFEELYIRLCS